MTELHHFAFGFLTPGIAYGISVLGCLLGLLCTARARGTTSRPARARWLSIAAIAIGGTGIWMMHFVAMIGFRIPSAEIRFDIPLTLASALIAIVVVGLGLLFVGYGQPTFFKILVGGLFTGVGVVAMHYSGMWAMQFPGEFDYDPLLVLASVVIAVVASSVALWFTVILRGPVPVTLGALLMGIAVTGMHYTGMAALRVRLESVSPGTDGGGMSVTAFVIALVVLGASVMAVVFAIFTSPMDEEEQSAPKPKLDDFMPIRSSTMETRTLQPHEYSGQ